MHAIEYEPALSVTPPAQDGFSLIPNATLLALYNAMLKCRRIDEHSTALFEQCGFRGTYKPAAGQEAMAAGVVIALRPEDHFIPLCSYSIPSVLKGLPLEKLFSRLPRAGVQSGFSRQLHLAAGLALACKTRKNRAIAVVYWSGEPVAPDRRPEREMSRWKETLHMASTHALPILFVRQNNTPLSAEPQTLPTPARSGSPTQPMGIPVIPVDGNDAVAVYRVVTESVARARQGRGPTLIDCRQWMDSNPIPNMEEYLTRKGLFRPDWKSQAEAEIDSQIAAAMSASVLPKTPSS